MNKKVISSTPFGSVGIIWSAASGNPAIVRVLLSKPGRSARELMSELYPDLRTATCAEVDGMAAGIKGLLLGEAIDFSLDLVDLRACGEFQRRVLRAEHKIPRGRVSTYRLIATHLGKTNGARAVGNALANNPFPLIVPCHRAIRSDRGLGGYQGGLEMKRALLAMEGIDFDNSGRVDCSRFHYDGSIE